MKKSDTSTSNLIQLSRPMKAIRRYYNRRIYPNRLVIIASFLTALCFFGIFVRSDWATDSYAISSGSRHTAYGRDAVLNGRPFSALFQYITLGVLHLPMARVTQLSSVLAIIEIGAAILICYRLYRRIIRADRGADRAVLWLLAVLTIINPMTVELFSFMERCVMVMGVLLAVTGADNFALYLKDGRTHDAVSSVVCGVLSILSYQGVYGTYIVLMALVAMIMSRGAKKMAKSMTAAIVLYLIPCLVAIVTIKLGDLAIGETGRGAAGINLSKAISVILPQLREIATFFDSIPLYVAPAICILTTIGAVVHLIIHHSINSTIRWAIGEVSLVFLSMCAAIAPLMMQRPDTIWISQRIVFPFGLVLAVWLTWYFACHLKYVNCRFMACGLLLLLAVELYKFEGFFTGRFEANIIDRYRTEWIVQQMNDYEKESHNVIKEIGFYYDANETRVDNGVMSTRDLNLSAFMTSWSDYSIINLYSGRYFIRAPRDQEYADYCSRHDWNTLDKDQIHFDGRTMNICLY